MALPGPIAGARAGGMVLALTSGRPIGRTRSPPSWARPAAEGPDRLVGVRPPNLRVSHDADRRRPSARAALVSRRPDALRRLGHQPPVCPGPGLRLQRPGLV